MMALRPMRGSLERTIITEIMYMMEDERIIGGWFGSARNAKGKIRKACRVIVGNNRGVRNKRSNNPRRQWILRGMLSKAEEREAR